MFFSYLQARNATPNSFSRSRRILMYLALSAILPLSASHAQSAPSDADELRETLLNAERAIMEGLSAQAIGAAPAAQIKTSLTSPAPEAQKAARVAPPVKQPPKPAPSAKKAATQVTPPKTQKTAEGPKAPSEFEVKAATLGRENEALRKQMEELRAQVQKLDSELQDTRSQLTLAETEATRLSTMVDAKTRASLGRYNVPMPAAPQPVRVATEQKAAPAVVKPAEDVKPPSRNADIQIATVTVDKADLRVGPGKNNSALMSLRRGSRLAVEDRQGEWYRVFAPNGQRAWIHSSLVSFGDGASNMNDGSAVRVKGYSVNAEEEAFRRLQKISPGK